MKNVTLSIDDQLLKEGRHYAQRHHTTLNNLVRELLNATVKKNRGSWLNEAFSLADKAAGDSKGKKWNRNELHPLHVDTGFVRNDHGRYRLLNPA